MILFLKMFKSNNSLILFPAIFFCSYLLALPNKVGKNYETNIFNKQRFSAVTCEPGLQLIKKQMKDETEIACQDAQGKIQGIAIRLNSKGKKVRAHIYRDNQITDEHTVEWDETGKINYTEEPHLRTSWYNFKKKKKHVETTLMDNRKETREWYQNGNLQSLSVEQEGLPPQVIGWDEKGNKLGSNP